MRTGWRPGRGGARGASIRVRERLVPVVPSQDPAGGAAREAPHPGSASRRTRRWVPCHCPGRGGLADPSGLRPPPDGRLGCGLAGDRAEVEPAALASGCGSDWCPWCRPRTRRAARRGRPPTRAQLAAELAAGSLVIALAVAAWLTRRAFDRRRMVAWDADWLATGPRWSPRR